MHNLKFLITKKYVLTLIIITFIGLGVIVFSSVSANKTPILSISNLKNNIETTDDNYMITGKIQNCSNTKLIINNNDVKIYDDCSFLFNIELKNGRNNIEIVATKNGLKSSETIVVNKISKNAPAKNNPDNTQTQSYRQEIYYNEDVQYDALPIQNQPKLTSDNHTITPITETPIEIAKTMPILSTEKNILSFNCSVNCTTVISENRINIKLLDTINPLTSYTFKATAAVSPKATINLNPQVEYNFGPISGLHEVVVTAEDGSTKIYTIAVEIDPSYVLIDTGSMSGYPWNESNCQMISYFSTGGTDGEGSDGHGYGCRQCVSYVAWRIAKETGKYYSWGSAVNFTQNAINAGYVEGAPQPGSIAVMDPAKAGQGYGHVAWVEAVNGNTVTISQYNYNYGAGYGMYSMMNLDVSAFDHYVKIK